MWDYHPTGAVKRSGGQSRGAVEQVTSSDRRRGAGDGEGRRRTRRELTETPRKVIAKRGGRQPNDIYVHIRQKRRKSSERDIL